MKGFNWDKIKTEEIITIREMLYNNPKNVLKDYKREYLKKILVENKHLFDKRNLNFWKIILEVKDEDFKTTDRSFRENCKIWHY